MFLLIVSIGELFCSSFTSTQLLYSTTYTYCFASSVSYWIVTLASSLQTKALLLRPGRKRRRCGYAWTASSPLVARTSTVSRPHTCQEPGHRATQVGHAELQLTHTLFVHRHYYWGNFCLVWSWVVKPLCLCVCVCLRVLFTEELKFFYAVKIVLLLSFSLCISYSTKLAFHVIIQGLWSKKHMLYPVYTSSYPYS